MAKVEFVIDDQLLNKFKQIVIRKRGKIELTPERKTQSGSTSRNTGGSSKRGLERASLSLRRSGR
jgi:hypothetical protein